MRVCTGSNIHLEGGNCFFEIGKVSMTSSILE
ncbi:sporulation protein YtfJ, partial [Klebsiella pneumoniae]|nr:sporulation protein YtfJ [Klebsiella pneumoniae]